MGGHPSKQTWEKIKEKAFSVTVADMIADNQQGRHETVALDTTIEAAVYTLYHNDGHSAAVTDPHTGDVVASIDMFNILVYLLQLYVGATDTKTVRTIHTYDTLFWDYWDGWVDEKVIQTPTKDADVIINTGATAFFSDSIKQLISNPYFASFSRSTPPALACDSSALLAQVLPNFAQGYQNMLVRDGPKMALSLSSIEILGVLHNSLKENKLDGLGNALLVSLNLALPAVVKVYMSSPALQAFRLMCTHGISAVPVVDIEDRILAEISTLDLGFIHSNNFSCLLTDVQSFCKVDKSISSPVTASLNTTLSNVLDKMFFHKRTHVWITDPLFPTTLHSVVSLRDILASINMHVNN